MLYLKEAMKGLLHDLLTGLPQGAEVNVVKIAPHNARRFCGATTWEY
jgi:hypothetical protein